MDSKVGNKKLNNRSNDNRYNSNSSSSDLGKDTIFEILKNQRRRFVIYYLKKKDDSAKLRDLADKVAAWENNTTVNNISSQERKRVYTALYQSHLPKMEKAGVINYERDNIELSDKASYLDIYLEIVPKDDIPWSHYYLGLSFLVSIFFFGSLFNIFIFSRFPNIAWFGLGVGLFVVSSAVNVYKSSKLNPENGQVLDKEQEMVYKSSEVKENEI